MIGRNNTSTKHAALSTRGLHRPYPRSLSRMTLREYATTPRDAERPRSRRLVRVIGACAIALVACSDTSLVDSITIVNDTDYPAQTEVTGGERNGWLLLTRAHQGQTTTVKEVIDQGSTWIFRFDYIGKHEEEIEFSRQELVQNDWTIEVPLNFEQRLRALGVPVPPE